MARVAATFPRGGEGRDEGALRQSEVNVVRSGHKNLTGKEKVKFLMLYQPLATIGPLPGKETVAHQPPSSIFGPRRPRARQKRGDKCAKKRQNATKSATGHPASGKRPLKICLSTVQKRPSFGCSINHLQQMTTHPAFPGRENWGEGVLWPMWSALFVRSGQPMVSLPHGQRQLAVRCGLSRSDVGYFFPLTELVAAKSIEAELVFLTLLSKRKSIEAELMQ